MALVRAILRSDLKDLTLVSWGGADVGLLVRAGKVRKLVYAFVSLDTIPLEPNFQRARQAGTIPEVVELDEGMFQTGLRAAAQRLPFLPMRAGLGSDVLVNNPTLRTVTSPYDAPDGARGAGGGPGAEPRRRAGPPEPRRPARQRDVPRAGPVLRRPVLHGRRARVRLLRADRRHRRADRRHPGPAAAAQPDDGRRRRRDPERRALHDLHPGLRAGRGVPEGVRRRGRRRRGLGGLRGALPVRRRGRRTRRRSAPSTRRRRDERRHPRRRSAPPRSPTRSRTTARSSPARWGCCRCSASGWPG